MDYSTFKKEAIENEPIFYETSMSDISIPNVNTLNIEGKDFRLSRDGIESLRKLVKLPERFSRKLSRYISDDAPAEMMEAFRRGITRNNNKDVIIGINSSNEEIDAVTTKFNRVSRGGYFDLIERVVDQYDLDITGFSEEGNTLRVQTEKKGQQYDFKKYEDEVFRAGPSFVSDLGSLEIHSFMLRLICTNGMVGMREDQDFQASLNREDMTDFFEYIHELSENHFIPEGFRENLDRAKQNRASLREVENISKTIASHFQGEKEELYDRIENFIPYYTIRDQYREAGEQPEEMSITQKKNAPTPVTAWEVANALTRFASHDQTDKGFDFDESDRDIMISQAGTYISKKTLDTENLVNVPNFRMN